MKFAKQFEFHKIPEWSEHYLDYYNLKTLLKKFKIKHQKSISILKSF